MISQASKILRAGGIVAFPTETVYGLGADATNPHAVAKIFDAKGRPATNPLIVHVADIDRAKRYAAVWPSTAQQLAEKFWPGPISLVVHKSPAIAENVTAGKNTVGLRMPDHPMALQLLREFDGPVAAPSANRSNRISPTTADHVRQELGDKVDLILNGGPCRVGIESTVLDLSGDTPTILRPGGISQQQIEAIIGPVKVFTGALAHSVAAVSPGQSAVHYSPITPAFRFESASEIQLYLRDKLNSQYGCIFICGKTETVEDSNVFILANDPADYAQQFYASLRALDRLELKSILIEMPPATREWEAVRDRIGRATKAV